MDVSEAFEALSILKTLTALVFRAVLDLPLALIRCCLRDLGFGAVDAGDDACVFYQGSVTHVRLKPKKNSFT